MKKALNQFPPVYFALVMSTGILSLAAHELELTALAEALFYVNLVAYPLLVLLFVGRALVGFRAFWAELTSHAQGPTFLAFMPATCLMGSQLVQLRHNMAAGNALWVLGLVGWAVLLYALLLGTSTARQKPDLEKGLTGAWLLLVVATEALVVLGARLAPQWPGPPEAAVLGLAGAFLVGAVLYVVLITLLVYRLTFVPLAGEEVGAAYWISVGASAITVLAGCTLLKAMQPAHALADLQPFIKGLSLLFWAISTWWLPLVAGLRLWNHLHTRPAFAYSPLYWSMVFPLGMYTAATLQLATALPLPALRVVPTYFFYLALLAWGFTFGAMLFHLVQQLRGGSPQATPPPAASAGRPA
ncbi:tellurite resistance/C4-dicarboxylate transporter family protein [Hymenobacter negativus]|uniref:Tellurite resistance/C4-dicarboxylate transporter family protein n=1 Tax=Hymenobacter negativus TaxID=2795026 RepID=A0ABS0Q417_9BACT|nr:tellurite resistance/C4-dicarboxylate transporter family protein [Hymenobacter negativus]MBH8557406.1 tellurite resistance/C4-dicarboxylate transporter family protein [Hymenobacter negativus]